jgi:arginyl-tRNA synthetase
MPGRIDERFNTFLQHAAASVAPAAQTASLRWEVPKEPSFGDLSSPAAFKLAADQRQPPPQVAQRLVAALQEMLQRTEAARWVDRIEATGGFVNVWLSPPALAETLLQIRRGRHRYGRSRLGRGRSIVIEFVSANPTGPLSVAHGRQAAVGDALARLLRSQGWRVTAEYYLNDAGQQIDLLGQSLRARCLQALGGTEPFPEDGYHGTYVTELAKTLVARYRRRLAEEPLAWFSAQGMAAQLAEITRDLDRFGLRFDRWSSQRRLRISGRIDRALARLKANGLLYESDGALWFCSTKFGDDKDRVVRKQDGELTYLAPDIAYHEWKFQRGYDRLINLWGPDHHGYIARLKAAVAALGRPADRLLVRIVQLVTLSRHGKPVPMSKRQGEFVTFREILDEVGVDATRFFYLMRTMESHLDFDVDLAKSQSNDNPVYYVQYAHARICSILQYARAQLPWFSRLGPADLALLGEPEERMVLRQLFQFPMVTRACAQALEPHGLTGYLRRLAELLHVFYTKHRVVTDDVSRSRARLALIQATRQVLANGLQLLGVSAPKRM